jgi:hypothetical protein
VAVEMPKIVFVGQSKKRKQNLHNVAVRQAIRLMLTLFPWPQANNNLDIISIVKAGKTPRDQGSHK